MSIIKDGLIKISKGFSYSVNIDLDIDNIEKIKTYIPTDYTTGLFESILDRSYGADILVGSYGTGKSHFATVLSSILINKFEENDYKGLLEKITITNKDLKTNIENRLETKNKKLLISPQHSVKDIKSSVLVGLKKSLKREGLEHIIPETSFDAVKNKILDWKENYKNTYDSFIKILEKEYKTESTNFMSKLEQYDEEVFTTFEQIYPELTAGSIFSPMHHIDLVDLLKKINRKIKEFSYEGLVVVFDEFGKYMEENIKTINLKDIQDIAEFTNDEKEKSNLILITHRDLSQYVNSKDKEALFEWRKVEGRFTKHIFKSDEYQIFDLIGKVLIKNEMKWKKFKVKNSLKFNEMLYDIFSIELFKDMPKKVQSTLIDNLYPIHPASAYSLIKLSDKLAQNERTTFTFLCSDKENTLIDYIENNKSDFPLINIDVIYDFYEDLMKKESKDGEIYNSWKNSKRALNSIDKKDEVKISIVKALAIINIIAQEDVLSSNDSNIRILANLSIDSFNKNVQELTKDKILIFRKSIDQYDFYQGSYLDIEKILEEISNEEYDFLELLESEFSLIPIMPRKHNDNNKINRLFECEYININSINENIDEKEYFKDVSDGKLLYFIPSKESEIKQAKDWVKNQNESVRTLVGIPNTYFEIVEKLNRYQKLRKLVEDEEFLNQDNLLEEEIKLYLEDTRMETYSELHKLTNNEYKYLDIYYKGNQKNINNRLELNNEISNICDEVYFATLKINNEMVNKNKLSNTMIRTIKNVIGSYWETDNILECEEYGEFSAEGTLIRTVFKNSNILNHKENQFEVIEAMKRFFKQSAKEEREFEELYKTLKDNPYGVKDGMIPILLAIILKDYPGQTYINKRGKGEDINPDILMNIATKPHHYSIYTEEWDEEKRIYIESLEDYFKEHIDIEKRKTNRLQALYYALKAKYMGMSRFSRSTHMISKSTIEVRAIIENEYVDLRKFFFETLKLNSKNYIEAYEKVEQLFEEMEEFSYLIVNNLKKFFIETFDLQNNSSIHKGIYNWYAQKKYNLNENNIQEGEYNILINIFSDSEKSLSDSSIINKVVYELKNFDVENLNDKMYEDIKESVLNFKKEIIKNKNNNDIKNYDYKISSSQEANNIQINLENIELDFLGESLLEKIIDDIDSFGESIDNKEKFKIVANLIKKYLLN